MELLLFHLFQECAGRRFVWFSLDCPERVGGTLLKSRVNSNVKLILEFAHTIAVFNALNKHRIDVLVHVHGRFVGPCF